MKPLTPKEAGELLAETGRDVGTWSPAGSNKQIRPAFADEQAQALLAMRSILQQQLAEWEGKKAEALQKLALIKHGGGS
jgi:hypothetical protein